MKNPLQDGWCFTKGPCQQNHLSVPSDIMDFLVTLLLQKYQDCREESLGDRTRCWIFLVVFWFGGGQEGCFLVFCLFALFVGFVLFFPFNFFHVTCFQPSSPRGQENLKKNKTKPKTQQQVSNTIFFPLQVKAVSTAVVYLLCLGKC